MKREALIAYLLEDAPFQMDPHEMDDLLSAVTFAASYMLDRDVTCDEAKEIYAVFDAETTLSVCSFLLMGLVRRASHIHLRAQEKEKCITVWITGRLREGKTPVGSLSDLLPEKGDYLAVVKHFMRENKMRFRVVKSEGVTLCLNIPRFFASSFVPASLKKKDACCALYVAMMAVAGKERPDFSVLQFDKAFCLD